MLPGFLLEGRGRERKESGSVHHDQYLLIQEALGPSDGQWSWVLENSFQWVAHAFKLSS